MVEKIQMTALLIFVVSYFFIRGEWTGAKFQVVIMVSFLASVGIGSLATLLRIWL